MEVPGGLMALEGVRGGGVVVRLVRTACGRIAKPVDGLGASPAGVLRNTMTSVMPQFPVLYQNHYSDNRILSSFKKWSFCFHGHPIKS